VYQIGVLVPIESSEAHPNVAAFRRGLRELGYVEGQSVAIEFRFAYGRGERCPELATELVRLPADVIVVGSAPASLAVKRATPAIPIVFVGAGDPVAIGLVASLARPGGLIGARFEEVRLLGAAPWVEAAIGFAAVPAA
jgi:putative ABC transport system substrate-binding protein